MAIFNSYVKLPEGIEYRIEVVLFDTQRIRDLR